jgi:YD repeat-containing protein
MTDPCGNAACTDMIGSGHTTTYSYNDSYASGSPTGNTNAYLTQVTRPVANIIAQTTKYSYNFPSGQLAASTDANGQTARYTYNDPLGRITATSYPDQGLTSYTYQDTAPSPSITTTKLLSATEGSEISVSVMDGVGHVVHTKLTSDPEGTDYVDTVWDGMGMRYTVSNPHRSSPQPTDGTSTYTYDSLGRTTLLSHPDGSQQQWHYNGNLTIFTNENNVSWSRTSDALGRLTNVVEPGSLQTTYGYDALGNLLRVTQSGTSGDTPRVRSFSYDSLSRLLSAANSETGTVSYGYDLNSNVTSKTDARGITTSYTYDALNRMTQKSYSDGVTSTILYGYDFSGVTFLVPGRSSARVAATLTNTIGRLAWSSVTGGLSLNAYSYDAMGRVINQWVSTPSYAIGTSPVFQIASAYDLAGNVIGRTYPDGLTLAQGYDAASYLTSITSNKTQFPTSLFASPSYSPPGGLTGATFGSGLVLNRSYDSRLRITGETDTGSVVANPTPGNAVITIIGAEQSH